MRLNQSIRQIRGKRWNKLNKKIALNEALKYNWGDVGGPSGSELILGWIKPKLERLNGPFVESDRKLVRAALKKVQLEGKEDAMIYYLEKALNQKLPAKERQQCIRAIAMLTPAEKIDPFVKEFAKLWREKKLNKKMIKLNV